MGIRNYHKEMEKIIEELAARGEKPRLLLHSCCAPCSTTCLERLAPYFQLVIYYYNPNIDREEEFMRRAREQQALLAQMALYDETEFIIGQYEKEVFYKACRGLEKEPEGGARCEVCFRLRLTEAANMALAQDCPYLTTTLTLSPLKNAALLNAIGEEVAGERGLRWLPTDFKKKNGYLRSLELSKAFDLYRQDYCGCIFSKTEREKQKAESREGKEPESFVNCTISKGEEGLQPLHKDVQ